METDISPSELSLARARDEAAWAAYELPRKLDDLCKLTEPATFYQSGHPKALGGNETEVFTIELMHRDYEDEGRTMAATFKITDSETKQWNKVQFWERTKGGWGVWVNDEKQRGVVESIPEYIDQQLEMPGRDTRAFLKARMDTSRGIITTRETDLRKFIEDVPATAPCM